MLTLFGSRIRAENADVLPETLVMAWLAQLPGYGMTVDARDLPSAQYVRLRTQALASAVPQTVTRIKNPKVSGGLESQVIAILQEEQQVLRTHNNLAHATERVAGAGESELAPQPVVPGGTADLQLRTWPSSVAEFMAQAPPLFPCATPTIAVVNGEAAGAVFTPLAIYNHYRIEGCGFGNDPGEVWLEIDADSVASSAQPVSMQLEQAGSWSENEIDVYLDPALSGISDSTATLVIRRPSGGFGTMAGCKFIAARSSPIPLKTIASSWVKLNTASAPLHSIRQLEYVSPPGHGTDVPRDSHEMSALVVRSDVDSFVAGSDAFDFSALNSGWVVDSIELQRYSAICPGDVTRAEQRGMWSANFDARGFTVAWARQSCWSFIPPIFRFAMSFSEYAVKVWVTGPAGTDPMRTDMLQNGVKHD